MACVLHSQWLDTTKPMKTVKVQHIVPESPGVRITLPIEVSGLDSNGRFFLERAFTTEVTRTGCRFLLTVDVDRASLLAIRTAGSASFNNMSAPMLFRVRSVEPEGDGWLLCAAAAETEYSGKVDSQEPDGVGANILKKMLL